MGRKREHGKGLGNHENDNKGISKSIRNIEC